MKTVREVLFIGDAFDDTELFSTRLQQRITSRLAGRCEGREIQLMDLSLLIGVLSNHLNDLQSQLLGVKVFAMVFTDEHLETLGEPDKSDRQRPIFDHGLDGVVRAEPFGTLIPIGDERDISFLQPLDGIIPIEQFISGVFERAPQAEEERHNLIQRIIFLEIAFDFEREERKVDSGEGYITPGFGGAIAVDVGADRRPATHGADLIKLEPCVGGGIAEDKPRLNTFADTFNGELGDIEVGIAIFEIDAVAQTVAEVGEYGIFAVAEPRHEGFEQTFGNQASLPRCIGAEVDRRESYLRAAPRAHRIHIINKSLHGLIDGSLG